MLEVKISIGGREANLDDLSIEQLDRMINILTLKRNAIQAIDKLTKAIDQTHKQGK